MRQNNPLLYIFVGMTDDSSERLCEIQSKRVDIRGVGYLSINDRYDKERLLADIREVQGRFLTTVYVTPGEIKDVYVVNADGPTASRLPDVKRDVDGYLTYLYPGGILTDIFLMLDDVLDISAATHRGAVVDMLAELHSDTCMLYMLSNLNSHKLYVPDARDNMLHCVALLGIMKDYVSLQSAEQIYKWYNERYFQEDCYRGGGIFMTVGYISISRPIALIKKLMLLELLTCRRPAGERECGFVWDRHDIPRDGWMRLKENIHGLGMDASLNLDGLSNYTNMQALEALFGRRLEQLFEVNFKSGYTSDGELQVRKYLRECARDPGLGFYYVHAATAPDGALRLTLQRLYDEAASALAAADRDVERWKGERCSPPKRWLIAGRVPEFVYELAVKYLEPKFDRLQPELELRRLGEAIEYVDACHREFDRKRKTLDELIERQRGEADDLRESDELFIDSGNLSAYYIGRLREFIARDPGFGAIYARLWRSLENEALDLHVAELESYIEKTVMPGEHFDRGIVDDLSGTWDSGGNEVYESIWRYISANRHFNILLKSGGKSLHSEINVFTDASGRLARWASGRDKINLFYEDNSDSIDVLYHGGAFSSGDLYYDALYRGQGL